MPDDNDPARLWDALRHLFGRMDAIDETEASHAKARADALMREHGLSFRKIIEQIKKCGVLLPLNADAAIQMMDATTPSEADVASANASLRGARRLLRNRGLSFEHVINAYIEFEQLHHNDQLLFSTMDRLRRDHRNAVDQLHRDYQAVVDTLERLRRDHRTAFDELRRKQTAFDELDRQHRTDLDELHRRHQTAFDELRRDHQASFEKNEREHQAVLKENKRLSQDQQASENKTQKLETDLNNISQRVSDLNDIIQRVSIFVVVLAVLLGVVVVALIGNRLWPPSTSIGSKSMTPSTTDPSVTGPSVTGPSVTGPSVTGPSVTGPSVTGPSVTGPSTMLRRRHSHLSDQVRMIKCPPLEYWGYCSWRSHDAPWRWQKECWRDRSIRDPCFD